MQESYLHVGEGDWYKTVEEPFPLLRHCGWAGRDGVYLCQNLQNELSSLLAGGVVGDATTHVDPLSLRLQSFFTFS
jgi:hypothetical protein